MGFNVFFDLDESIVEGIVGLMFMRHLESMGLFDPNVKRMFDEDIRRYHRGEIDYDALGRLLSDRWVEGVKGRLASDVRKEAAEFVKTLRFRVKPGFELLGKEGIGHFVLTASPPQELADEIGRALRTKVVGVDLPKDGGRYTGERPARYMWDEKPLLMKKLGESHTSIAVGDSNGDIPFLNAADLPIAITPKPDLRRHAERRGWPIIEENEKHLIEQKVVERKRAHRRIG